MSEYQEPIQVSTTGTPRWVGIAVVVLGGTSLLGLGIGWSALNHANSVQQATQASVRQANDALTQRLAKEDEIEIPVQINGKLRSRFVVSADAAEEIVLERALADEKVRAAIAGKQIVKKIYVPGKLVNIVVK